MDRMLSFHLREKHITCDLTQKAYVIWPFIISAGNSEVPLIGEWALLYAPSVFLNLARKGNTVLENTREAGYSKEQRTVYFLHTVP